MTFHLLALLHLTTERCAAGWANFSTDGSTNTCTQCFEGKYQSAPGSTECMSCPTGQISPAGSTTQAACYAAHVVVFSIELQGSDIAASKVCVCL